MRRLDVAKSSSPIPLLADEISKSLWHDRATRDSVLRDKEPSILWLKYGDFPIKVLSSFSEEDALITLIT